MFNFLGNHKIGIIGDANSGKTVLLTSMLWNLEANNLALGEKRAKPTSIEVCKLKKRASAHSFNYEDNKLKLKRKNDWPAKTVGDYSLAQCAYDLPGLSLRHKVTFVDIPGERLADVAIWENSSYSDWSEILLNQWKSSEIYTECLADFMALLSFEQMPNTLGFMVYPPPQMADYCHLFRRSKAPSEPHQGDRGNGSPASGSQKQAEDGGFRHGE